MRRRRQSSVGPLSSLSLSLFLLVSPGRVEWNAGIRVAKRSTTRRLDNIRRLFPRGSGHGSVCTCLYGQESTTFLLVYTPGSHHGSVKKFRE
jgi:hypothetical protein